MSWNQHKYKLNAVSVHSGINKFFTNKTPLFNFLNYCIIKVALDNCYLFNLLSTRRVGAKNSWISTRLRRVCLIHQSPIIYTRYCLYVPTLRLALFIFLFSQFWISLSLSLIVFLFSPFSLPFVSHFLPFSN